MTEKTIVYCHIVSDSAGDSAQAVARATFAQFTHIETILKKHPFVDNEEDLDFFFADLEEQTKAGDKVIVYLTLADNHFASVVESFCREHHFECINLLQPYIQKITRLTGLDPNREIGAQYELTSNYFKRVEAMEFAIKYDDGQDLEGLALAEIVILGISRTGKTPLSIYLANAGFKVANLPIIPENDVPRELFEINSKKIIGLTNDLEVIQRHRITRMREYGMPENSRYSSERRIRKEIDYANELYERLQIPIINVAARSIEETASIITEIMDLPNHLVF